MIRAARGLCLAAVASVALLAPAAYGAPEPKPFAPGSLKAIQAARGGHPFVLAFWSLSCTYCHEEFALFGELLKKYPALDIVLVATDTPAESEALVDTLGRYGLEGVESWVFADESAERLRYEVDPKWGGELPRTYFYASDHGRRAQSGRLDRERLEAWIKQQLGKVPPR